MKKKYMKVWKGRIESSNFTYSTGLDNTTIISRKCVAVVFAQKLFDQDTFHPKQFWPKSGYAILG